VTDDGKRIHGTGEKNIFEKKLSIGRIVYICGIYMI
jgi:hypothetical protein